MPDSTNWPGGWYVYEDGRVSGPLAADEAFGLQAEAPSGKPRMVSRKGFSQWYALKDLSEIFRLTEEMGRKTRDEMIANPPPSPPSVPASPEVKMRTVGKPRQASKAALPQPLAPATPASAPDPEIKPTKADAAFAYVPPSTMSQQKQRSAAKPAASVKTKVVSAQAALLQEYLIQRGRLRLGKLRNPWINAFVGLPATLGVLWAVWMNELAREVTLHCGPGKQKQAMTLPPAFLAMIPGFHVYMTWRLAKLISEMEAQNRYSVVSPGTAAWLALFPPFAMAYLQDAVNKHWLLHVRHTMGGPAAAVAPVTTAPAATAAEPVAVQAG
jgi:hypothetical protein